MKIDVEVEKNIFQRKKREFTTAKPESEEEEEEAVMPDPFAPKPAALIPAPLPGAINAVVGAGGVSLQGSRMGEQGGRRLV